MIGWQLWTPKTKELLAIFALSVLLRVAIIFAVCLNSHISVAEFLIKEHDGQSYFALAQAISGDSHNLTELDQREFPGYPALIAGVHALAVPIPASALLLNLVSAGLASAMAALLFEDLKVGWALAVLTPSYLKFSCLAMTEPTLLAMCLGGLLLSKLSKDALAGAMLGFAFLIKAPAVFAALGQAIVLFRTSKRRCATFTFFFAATIVAGFYCLRLSGLDLATTVHVISADPRTYGGDLLTWPFKSLIFTPLLWNTPIWKVLFTWAHVILTLGGCFLLLRQWRQSGQAERSLVLMACIWLSANTLSCLCIGNIGGFHQYHRYMIAALPPLFWSYRRFLPRQPVFWLLVGLASALAAYFGLMHPDFLPERFIRY